MRTATRWVMGLCCMAAFTVACADEHAGGGGTSVPVGPCMAASRRVPARVGPEPVSSFQVLTVFAMWKLFHGLGMGADDNRFVLRDFPFYFIAVRDVEGFDRGVKNGFPLRMIRYDNDKRPPMPMNLHGTWWWEARECKNARCPYLVEDQKDVPEADRATFKFPHVRRGDIAARIEWAKAGYPSYHLEYGEEPTPEQIERLAKFEEMMMARVQCPRCMGGGVDEEDMEADEYYDEEGRKMVAELNALILDMVKRR